MQYSITWSHVTCFHHAQRWADFVLLTNDCEYNIQLDLTWIWDLRIWDLRSVLFAEPTRIAFRLNPRPFSFFHYCMYNIIDQRLVHWRTNGVTAFLLDLDRVLGQKDITKKVLFSKFEMHWRGVWGSEWFFLLCCENGTRLRFASDTEWYLWGLGGGFGMSLGWGYRMLKINGTTDEKEEEKMTKKEEKEQEE